MEPITASVPLGVGRVLVVDDHAANRMLLRDLLEAHGHSVTEATDGLAALAATAADPPDVILLDVQMPGMSGFEVCRQLKAAPDTAAIPVLLVTALVAREDRLEGIRAGANDFINKPIDTVDLPMRVRNAVQSRQLFTKVKRQYDQLRELEQLRDNLVHMVVHDLRSPLSVVYATLQLIEMSVTQRDGELGSLVGSSMFVLRDVIDMVSDVLDVSRMEAGQMPLARATVDLGVLAGDATRYVPRATVRIVSAPSPRPALVNVDRKLITRVLANLVNNAVKFTPDGGTVHVAVSTGERGVTASVRDAGPGIPEEAQAMIFEKFGQVQGVRQRHRSTGLGLTFCKLAVEAHGGQIGVESVPGAGSVFWFTLPQEASSGRD